MHSNTIRNTCLSGLSLILLCASSHAIAEDDFFGTGYNKSLSVRLSGFQASSKTTLRVDSKSGIIGEEISLEDDLDLADRKTLPLIDITYRFNPRHMVDFSYVNLSRDGTAVFTQTGTTTDDILWAAGAELSSNFESEVYRLAYGYSFINDGKKELGLLLGLHLTRFNVSLSGRGSLVAVDPDTGEEVVVEGEARRSFDSGFTVPLPVIGAHGTYAFTPNLNLRGWGQLFALEYEDYDGSLFNAAAMLEYAISKNFGLGVGYAYYNYDLDVESELLKRSFTYEFNGPTLFLNASF